MSATTHNRHSTLPDLRSATEAEAAKTRCIRRLTAEYEYLCRPPDVTTYFSPENQNLRELELFFAVLFEVGLHRIFRVASAVNYMAPSYVGMVCSLLVTSSLVMLCRLSVMASGMREMFGRLLVMFCSFL
jgi:hypothetical protein